jgi:peptide/nickel transport system substrate-binding protein
MGCRRCSSDLIRSDRASARLSVAFRRRTSLWSWCGVFFFVTLPACGSSDPAPRPSQNVLTIGLPEVGGVTDVGLGLDQLISILTLEGLTQVNVSIDGRARPRLAESWTWENNGLRLRLNLRSGVAFHDGTAFTSAIAAEALSRAIARPGNRALYPSLSDITAVHADGDRQLILELSRPSAFLPEELDLPLEVGEKNSGTGAFRLASRDPSGTVLERVDGYYLGTPPIRQIVIRPFDTLRQAWAGLLRGEVDMVTEVPPEAVEFIRNEEVQVISFARSYQFLVAFNSQKPPFTSSAVRRALNATINREVLIKNVLGGQGESATGPLWPRHWAYDASIPPFSFDPQGAVSSLEAAGFRIPPTAGTPDSVPARLRFTCLIPQDFSLLERVGLEVQKQLYDVGVDMQFEVVTFQEYNSRIRDSQFDAVLVNLISGPTFSRPYIFWRSARESKGMNFFGYENVETERLFQVLRTSMNEAAVRSATSRLQRALLEDPPALFLVWEERARAISRNFRIVEAPGRDPLHTIWRWTENTDREPVSTQ